MVSKEQALHKAERQFSQLKKLVGQAIDEGWRVDELERATFAELLDLGLTAFVAALLAPKAESLRAEIGRPTSPAVHLSAFQERRKALAKYQQA